MQAHSAKCMASCFMYAKRRRAVRNTRGQVNLFQDLLHLGAVVDVLRYGNKVEQQSKHIQTILYTMKY